MDTKFPFKNEVEKDMDIIEEETSDEDNSSKDSTSGEQAAKTLKQEIAIKEETKNQATYETGEINEIKRKDTDPSSNKFVHNSSRDLLAEKRSRKNIDSIEEEKVPNNLLSDSFQDIRESYDFIRQHRSSSCKSAAVPLHFSKRRYLTKKASNTPFVPLSKKSNHLSTSASMGRSNITSLFGL